MDPEEKECPNCMGDEDECTCTLEQIQAAVSRLELAGEFYNKTMQER